MLRDHGYGVRNYQGQGAIDCGPIGRRCWMGKVCRRGSEEDEFEEGTVG